MESWIEPIRPVFAALVPLFDLARSALWSLPAQRIYVLEIGLTILALSLYAAIGANRWASANILLAQKRFSTGVPGPPPDTRDRFEWQQVCIVLAKARSLRATAGLALAISVGAGVVVPTALLFLATLRYRWLDVGGGHLLDRARNELSDPGLWQSALFTVDQTLRGGLFDVFEVFAWQVTTLDNNPANFWFSVGVFFHHLFVEAFIFSGLVLFGRSHWRIRTFLNHALLRNWEKFENHRPGVAPRPIAGEPARLRRLRTDCKKPGKSAAGPPVSRSVP